MNDQPVNKLKQLIQQYGEELTADPRRTEALLNDYCPAYRTEVFVLVNAQRQQVPADLLATPKWMPSDAAAARLSVRLQDRLALSADAADWAVHSWSVALGLQHNPTVVSRLLDRTRRAFTPHARRKSTPSRSGQSDAIGVQSGATDSTTESAKTPAPSPQPVAFAEPVLRPAPAKTRSVRGHFGLAAAVTAFAVVWLLAVSVPTWSAALTWPQPTARFAGAQERSSVVAALYPLPRSAWVSAGPLNVRAGPDMAEPSLSMLPVGQSVQVIGYSDDKQWSQIVQPAEGWVSNRYLDFLTDDEPSISVSLELRQMEATTDETLIYSQPDLNSPVIGRIQAGEPAVTVAVTQDGYWRQTAQPVVGWVQANRLVSKEGETTRMPGSLPDWLHMPELKRMLDAWRTRPK